MEYLEGESLRQALTRRGPLPVAEVAEILQQAARGLNAAHKLGIVHRDLKPDNIFLTYPDDVGAPLAGAHDAAEDVGAGLVPALPVGIADTGRAQDPPLRSVVVKLVDFGIAKLRESGAHTQTGMVLGTPAYMSFEQASGMRSDELEARSDIYSLGVVTYEMLTGRTLFHSGTPVGYLRMHLQEDPPPFRAVKPNLPAVPQLESVVMKALTKDRNQRYGSAINFARAFMSAAQPTPAAEISEPLPSTKVVGLAARVSQNETKIAAPQGRAQGTPVPAKLPAVTEVSPWARQLTNVDNYATPSPTALRGTHARKSAIVSFLYEPRYTLWFNLPLLGLIVVTIAEIIANTELMHPSYGESPTIRIWASYGAIHTLILGSALITSSRHTGRLRDNPARPGPRLFGLVCLLAILVGFNSVVPIFLGKLEFLDYGVVPYPFVQFTGNFLYLTHVFDPFLGFAAVDLIGLILTGLRIRCRPFEWALLFSFVLGPIFIMLSLR